MPSSAANAFGKRAAHFPCETAEWPWAAPSTTSVANAYGAASNVRTSISTNKTQYVSCTLGWPLISTSTTMKDRIKVPTIARRRNSSSCSVQSRPHSPKMHLIFPFRGPKIGANHNWLVDAHT